MSSLDERTWLNDELWAQVRPPPARFRVTISVATLVATVSAVVLSQIGFFHPRIGASYNQANARGNRLIVVLALYDSAQVPVRVTGFRAAQPGTRIVSARLNGVFPPIPDNPAPRRHPRRTVHRARTAALGNGHHRLLARLREAASAAARQHRHTYLFRQPDEHRNPGWLDERATETDMSSGLTNLQMCKKSPL